MFSPSNLFHRATGPFHFAFQQTRTCLWDRITRRQETRQTAISIEDLDWTTTFVARDEINLILQLGLFDKLPYCASKKKKNS